MLWLLPADNWQLCLFLISIHKQCINTVYIAAKQGVVVVATMEAVEIKVWIRMWEAAAHGDNATWCYEVKKYCFTPCSKNVCCCTVLRWDRRVGESFWQISVLENGQKIWDFSNLQFVLLWWTHTCSLRMFIKNLCGRYFCIPEGDRCLSPVV